MQMLTAPPLGVAAHLLESDRAEHPFADAAISMIDARDVAAVGAAILVSDDPEAQHGSRTYELTGPAAATLPATSRAGERPAAARASGRLRLHRVRRRCGHSRGSGRAPRRLSRRARRVL